MNHDETPSQQEREMHTMEIGVPAQAPAARQKTNWLASFSGLIPIFLILPFLILQLWVICIVLAIVSSLALIIWSLTKTRTVASLDLLSLSFGLANAVLYFGFHNLFLLERLGSVIYTLLFLQVVYSLVRGEPWTEQYAKRSASPEMQQHPLFRETNRFLTIVWGVSFLISDVISFAGNGLWPTLIPLALMAATAVSTPVLARWYAHLRMRTSV